MGENEIVIDVRNISKTFKVYNDKSNQLKERLIFWNRNKYEKREVLKDISFQIRRGEAVGLIGNNGCGKSTTLKMLTKIMYPDKGKIVTKGRISSLIELGAGFHQDLSGRENIYTNASIFGLSRKEIDARIDKIIAFSELEAYMDNPVRTYSSGMYMRLAFSVAINVDADILLIDEILAVGDTNFQAKCYEKLREIKANGTTIVIVTHDTGTIQRFCDRAIWLNNGRVEAEGQAVNIADAYISYMNNKHVSRILEDESLECDHEIGSRAIDDNHFGLDPSAITAAYVLNSSGEKTQVIQTGENIEIVINYSLNITLNKCIFGMGICDQDGRYLYGNNTQLDCVDTGLNKKDGSVRYIVHDFPLLPGKYGLNVSIIDENNSPVDFYRIFLWLTVFSEDRSEGVVYFKHHWEVD